MSSTLPVSSHVSQKGRKVFTANSLHSSVSENSAHIRRLHGRKHNLFDATLPTRPEPPSSSHWGSQCLTSISYSEQADRQMSAGNGLHLDTNQHFNRRLNVIWKESTRSSRIAPLEIFVFYLFGEV